MLTTIIVQPQNYYIKPINGVIRLTCLRRLPFTAWSNPGGGVVAPDDE